MCDLKGKIASVSGAAQGIGARTAEVMAEAGAVVVVTDVNDATGEATVARIRAAGHEAHFQHLDVTCEEDWKSVMNDVCAKSGGLDVLVNNAGVELIKPLAELTLEDWHWICRINLDGVSLGTKYGIRAMTDGSTSRPKGGSIISLSSLAGLVAGAFQSAYCMTKGGVRLFTKSAAVECARLKTGVRVNSVHPAVIRTPMWEGAVSVATAVRAGKNDEETRALVLSKHPIGRLGEADDVAKAIRYLASDDSSFVTRGRARRGWGIHGGVK